VRTFVSLLVVVMCGVPLRAEASPRDERPVFRVHVKVIEVSRTALESHGISRGAPAALTPAQLRMPVAFSWPNPIVVDDGGPALRQLDAWLEHPQKPARVVTAISRAMQSGHKLEIEIPDDSSTVDDTSDPKSNPAEASPRSSLRLWAEVQADGTLWLQSDVEKSVVINGQTIPGSGLREDKFGTAVLSPSQHVLLIDTPRPRVVRSEPKWRGSALGLRIETAERIIQITPGAIAPQAKQATVVAESATKSPTILATAVAPLDPTQAKSGAVTFAGPPIAKYTGPESKVHIRVIELSRDPPTPDHKSNFEQTALAELIGGHHEFRHMHFPTVRIGPGDPIKAQIEKWLSGTDPRARVVREQTFVTGNGETLPFEAFEGCPEFQAFDRKLGGSTPERPVHTMLSFSARREDDGRVDFRCGSYFARPKSEQAVPRLNDWRDISITTHMAPKQSIVVCGITRVRIAGTKLRLPAVVTGKEQLEHYEILIEMTPELFWTVPDVAKLRAVESSSAKGPPAAER